MLLSERAEMHRRHWQKVEVGTNNTTRAAVVRMAGALRVTPAKLMAEPPPGLEESGGARERTLSYSFSGARRFLRQFWG